MIYNKPKWLRSHNIHYSLKLSSQILVMFIAAVGGLLYGMIDLKMTLPFAIGLTDRY